MNLNQKLFGLCGRFMRRTSHTHTIMPNVQGLALLGNLKIARPEPKPH